MFRQAGLSKRGRTALLFQAWRLAAAHAALQPLPPDQVQDDAAARRAQRRSRPDEERTQQATLAKAAARDARENASQLDTRVAWLTWFWARLRAEQKQPARKRSARG